MAQTHQSALLTSCWYAGDNHLDCSEIEDGYGGRSCRVGAGQQAGRIAGMIARAQQQIGQLRADLVHVNATVRLFASAMEPETIPAKRVRQSDLRFEPGGLCAPERRSSPVEVESTQEVVGRTW